MKRNIEDMTNFIQSRIDSDHYESCEFNDSEQQSISSSGHLKDLQHDFICLSVVGEGSKPSRSIDCSSKGLSTGDDFVAPESDIQSINEFLDTDQEYQKNVRYDLKQIFDLNISQLEIKATEDEDKPYFKIKDSLKFLTNSLQNKGEISLASWDNYIKLRLKKILNKKKGSVCLQQLLPLCESIGLIDSIYDEVSSLINLIL